MRRALTSGKGNPAPGVDPRRFDLRMPEHAYRVAAAGSACSEAAVDADY